jgi:hypothetical protein
MQRKVQNLHKIQNLNKIKSKKKWIRISNNLQILKIYNILTDKTNKKLLMKVRRVVLLLMMGLPST